MKQTLVIIAILISGVFQGGEGMSAEKTVRYVALGDSYTIGTGARPEQSWPAVITERLKTKGIAISLEANLGRSGWTSQDLIDFQLPEAERLRPDLVTVLIGTNDWVHGMDAATYRTNIREIFKRLVQLVPDRARIIVVTCPDFSLMPVGAEYSGGRDITQGIAEFNEIVMEEAQAYPLTVVDLYPFSRTIEEDKFYASPDGLHPSAKGYARWADVIQPSFDDLDL